METYLFYDSTGAILRMQTYSFAADPAFVAANTPTGQTAMLAPAGHPVLSNPGGWQIVNGALAQIVPTAEQLLQRAQTAQIELLGAAYQSAVATAVSYLGTTFLDDPAHQQLLARAAQAYTLAGAVPTGFFVPDVNLQPVAMTLAQLQGLVAAIAAQEWGAFSRWMTLQGEVAAATTVAAAQAIVWA